MRCHACDEHTHGQWESSAVFSLSWIRNKEGGGGQDDFKEKEKKDLRRVWWGSGKSTKTSWVSPLLQRAPPTHQARSSRPEKCSNGTTSLRRASQILSPASAPSVGWLGGPLISSIFCFSSSPHHLKIRQSNSCFTKYLYFTIGIVWYPGDSLTRISRLDEAFTFAVELKWSYHLQILTVCDDKIRN